MPPGLYARSRMGIRPLLHARRAAAGPARAAAGHGAKLRGFRRRADAGRGLGAGRGRPLPHASLPRRRALCRVRVARGAPAVGPRRRGRGPSQPGERRGGRHVAPRADPPLHDRPRAGPAGLHAPPPQRVAGPGGPPQGGPWLPRAPGRRRGLRDEPHVPARSALRRRVLRHGVAVRALLPLAVPRRRDPGGAVLGAPVLPDGAGGPQGPLRPHRSAGGDRPRRDVRGKRLEHPARQRPDLLRLPRHAGGGAPGRAAGPAERPAGRPRARRQPARRGVPRVRAEDRWARPRRTRRRGAARGPRRRRPRRGAVGRTRPRGRRRPVRPLVPRQRRPDRGGRPGARG